MLRSYVSIVHEPELDAMTEGRRKSICRTVTIVSDHDSDDGDHSESFTLDETYRSGSKSHSNVRGLPGDTDEEDEEDEIPEYVLNQKRVGETRPSVAWLRWMTAIDEVRSGRMQLLEKGLGGAQGNRLVGKELQYTPGDGKSNLHVALLKGDTALFKEMVLEGVYDLDQQDNVGMTPMHVAAYVGEADCVRFLIAHGASLDIGESDFDRTPLHLAAAFGWTAIVHLLIYVDADINALDDDGNTPLHRAAQMGSFEACKKLVIAGSTTLARSTATGDTPLHLAAKNNEEETALIIIKHGEKACVASRDFQGNTALHMAAKGNRSLLCHMLLEHGAETKVRNHNGDMPYDLCTTKNLKQLLDPTKKVEVPEATTSPRQMAINMKRARAQRRSMMLYRGSFSSHMLTTVAHTRRESTIVEEGGRKDSTEDFIEKIVLRNRNRKLKKEFMVVKDKAARVIQRHYRGHAVRADIRRQDNAARKIQKVHRNKMQKLKEEIEARAAARKYAEDASTTISKHYKGYRTRTRYKKQKESAVKIQRTVRHRLSPKKTSRSPKNSPHYRIHKQRYATHRHSDAASVIQSVYRRHRARSLPQRPKVAGRVFDGDSAATKIQKMYRGYSVRALSLTPRRGEHAEFMIVKENSATSIQRIFRGYRIRSLHPEVSHALLLRRRTRGDSLAAPLNFRPPITKLVDEIRSHVATFSSVVTDDSAVAIDLVPRVVQAEDMTSKYGLGYLLSDGYVGCLFNDSSKMLLAPDGHLEYIARVRNNNGNFDRRMVFHLSTYPIELKKKVIITKYFYKQFHDGDNLDALKGFANVEPGIWYQHPSPHPATCMPPRCGHTSVAVDGGSSVLVFGGEDRADNYMNDLWQLSLVSMTWSKWHEPEARTVPPARAEHTASLTNGDSCMIVFGGKDERKCFNDLWILDFVSQEWKEISCKEGQSWPSPRYGHTTVTSHNGDLLYMFGGCTDAGRCSNELWVEWTLEWAHTDTSGGPAEKVVPSPRRNHVAYMNESSSGSKIVVMWGYQGDTVRVEDNWIYDLSSRKWYAFKAQSRLQHRCGNSLVPVGSHFGPLRGSNSAAVSVRGEDTSRRVAPTTCFKLRQSKSSESGVDFHVKSVVSSKGQEGSSRQRGSAVLTNRCSIVCIGGMSLQHDASRGIPVEVVHNDLQELILDDIMLDLHCRTRSSPYVKRWIGNNNAAVFHLSNDCLQATFTSGEAVTLTLESSPRVSIVHNDGACVTGELAKVIYHSPIDITAMLSTIRDLTRLMKDRTRAAV